ncbi:hypothetical protein BMS3Abin06_00593 [bacterium BMS3Abin06]|nr:hypothetical protein BMS3Abin06_00593 [bacterium BMS3Abin06]
MSGVILILFQNPDKSIGYKILEPGVIGIDSKGDSGGFRITNRRLLRGNKKNLKNQYLTSRIIDFTALITLSFIS